MSRFRPLRGRGVGICDTPLRPGMCGPSKNHPVFVLFGADWWAYSIRPYDRIRAILRNTDAILQLGTCEGSKNGSVYATVGGVWWGVCNTSLRPGTCCLSKKCPVFVPFGAVCGAYAIRPYDRVRAALQKTVSFSSPSGSRGGRMRYAPTTWYVRPFKKLSRFRPLRGRLWGVCNTPLRLGMCDPSKYRYDLSTGGAGAFGMWGGGGYRLRGRRA